MAAVAPSVWIVVATALARVQVRAVVNAAAVVVPSCAAPILNSATLLCQYCWSASRGTTVRAPVVFVPPASSTNSGNPRAPTDRNAAASPTIGSTFPRDPNVDNNTRNS
ncbi:hypothetical protein [Nocardia sp. NPDC050175]|uniref:hypothetical protein n=1 Tax=Nocardia sp. NPDC050175 TaxID=3364317 RepID=UPI0037B14B73